MERGDHLVFISGNTRITVMENYEALGRYTAAKEQAEHFRDERNTLLVDLWKQTQRATTTTADSYPRTPFDVEKARELLDRIDEAQHNLLTAINEANLYADDCKKPKLQTFAS